MFIGRSTQPSRTLPQRLLRLWPSATTQYRFSLRRHRFGLANLQSDEDNTNKRRSSGVVHDEQAPLSEDILESCYIYHSISMVARWTHMKDSREQRGSIRLLNTTLKEMNEQGKGYYGA